VKLAALLLLALPAWPQATVVFKPTMVYAKKQIWTVSIKSDNPAAPQSYPREAITQLAPAISEYPNDIAQDVMLAAATRNPGSFLTKLWGILAPPAAGALNGLAIARKTNGPLYISAGISAIDLGIALVGSRAPQPQKYFAEMLPANVGLPPGGGATYGLVSDAVKNPQPLGPFHLPANAPTAAPAVAAGAGDGSLWKMGDFIPDKESVWSGPGTLVFR